MKFHLHLGPLSFFTKKVQSCSLSFLHPCTFSLISRIKPIVSPSSVIAIGSVYLGTNSQRITVPFLGVGKSYPKRQGNFSYHTHVSCIFSFSLRRRCFVACRIHSIPFCLPSTNLFYFNVKIFRLDVRPSWRLLGFNTPSASLHRPTRATPVSIANIDPGLAPRSN